MNFDLIIPCYNPPCGWEKRLVLTLQDLTNTYLKVKKDSIHIIIINDGSIKNFTEKEIRFLERSDFVIQIIQNTLNKGKGFSLREGVNASRSPYCIYTDIDFPFGISVVTTIMTKLRDGADIVIGSRNKQQYFQHASFSRKLISASLMCFNKHLLLLKVEDTQAGIKGFNLYGKSIFLKTTINRFLFDLEFICMASNIHGIILETVPVYTVKEHVLSDFGLKTLIQELRNFIIILGKRKAIEYDKKDTVWN